MSRIALYIVLLSMASIVGSVDRPRGVPIAKMSLYNPAQPFTCFDGSHSIDFTQVNDDYCDCLDGSDEPGTSACPNGFFTCPNKGHIPKTIPSSRVNDGICDCCDGSDEYGKHEFCENRCLELGRAAREEEEKKRQRLVEGNKVYLEYVAQGEKAKKENKERLDQLIKEKETLETERTELEEKKKQAEVPEKAAKDAHEQAWQEIKNKREAERNEEKAQKAFNDLDTDDDGSLSVPELKNRLEFDTDGDGEVTEEEAKSFLNGHDSVNLETYKNDVWDGMKSIYREPQAEPTEAPTKDVEESTLDEDDDRLDELLPDEKEIDEDDDDHEKAHDVDKEIDEMPEYPEETKQLIAAADFARDAFNNVDQKYRDLEKDIRDLEELENIDFGPGLAFSALKGQCFEYTDREYTYKVCMFERASQRPKNGGSETSLGTWGSWIGPENDVYSKQKYEHGQNCWNGPDRSLTVSLDCGGTNELTSVSEPSRCEYHAVLHTPALCSHVPPPIKPDPEHDEL